MTHEDFIKRLIVKNPEAVKALKFLERYKKAHSKILALSKYGPVKITPVALLSGRMPNIDSALNKHKYFLSQLNEANPSAIKELLFLEEYHSANRKLLVKNKYGKLLVTPSKLLNSRVPGIMSAVDKTEYFSNRSIEIHGMKKYNYDKTVYKKDNLKVEIYCNDCKIYFLQYPTHHLKGVGCPKCRDSHGERRVRNELERYSVKYETQKTFDGCKSKALLKFDFYLPKYNVCIEYDGEQHFKPCGFGGIGKEESLDNLINCMKRDKIKDKFCKDNKIELIRIPYTRIKTVENFIKMLYLEKENLI